MKYEVKKIDLVNRPQFKNETTLTQCVNVYTGIVGQKYDGFTTVDTFNIDFPNSGFDYKQIEEYIQVKCDELSKEKYPDYE